jgi:hypothetical protein
MTPEQMSHALSLNHQAGSLRKQYDKYVLLRKDHNAKEEVLNVGDPAGRDQYNRVFVPIPEAARRHVFHLWRREIALKHNAIVRELNQLGVKHGHSLIALRSADNG